MAKRETRIKAVKRQAEKADKIWKEVYGDTPANPTETPAPAPDPQNAAPQPQDPPTPPANPEPAPSPQPTPPDYKTLYEQATAQAQSTQAQLETERQRFLTLQGKYNNEVPRLTAELANLKTTVETIQSRAPQTPPAQPSPGNGSARKTGAAQTLKMEFPDIYDGVVDLFMELMGTQLESVNSRLARTEEERQRAAQDNFSNKLTELVPDWGALNTDAGFVAYLQELEPHGRSRYDMLMDAFQRQDVKGVSYYFIEYKKRKNPAPANPTPPANPPADPNANVTIPRGGSPPAPPAPQAETFTRADLANLYDEKVRGLYRGKEAEFRAKEAKMIAHLTSQGR